MFIVYWFYKSFIVYISSIPFLPMPRPSSDTLPENQDIPHTGPLLEAPCHSRLPDRSRMYHEQPVQSGISVRFHSAFVPFRSVYGRFRLVSRLLRIWLHCSSLRHTCSLHHGAVWSRLDICSVRSIYRLRHFLWNMLWSRLHDRFRIHSMGLLLREYACLYTGLWLTVHAALWLGNYRRRFLCHTEQTSFAGLFLYFLHPGINLLLFLTRTCFSHVIASENLFAAVASSAFLRSFSIFSRFSLASFDSAGTVGALDDLVCDVAFSACFSKFSALTSSPCTFCIGWSMVCRKPISSSAGVPFTTNGTMFCRVSSFRLFRLGMTATLRLLSTLRILIFRSVPAVIIVSIR